MGPRGPGGGGLEEPADAPAEFVESRFLTLETEPTAEMADEVDKKSLLALWVRLQWVLIDMSKQTCYANNVGNVVWSACFIKPCSLRCFSS